jgi:hypothetical protein
MSKHTHVEIDAADPEHTHVWVELHNHKGLDKIVGQYPADQRRHAYAMARNLADSLGLPLKINEGGDQPRLIEGSDFFPSNS